ncbi:hypothetical protein AAFP30_01200 [Gordonia sp. CPCC 205515]|uniref:hypothetical protein n=1 Tax=Gordonia sp. CPCC 205515 TaxID=3140791 RepID=UPI003AF3DD87
MSDDRLTLADLPLTLPLLRPGTPVLVRPGNRVHIGSDPRRSLLIDLPQAVRASDVAELIRALIEPHSRGQMVRRARAIGLSGSEFAGIVGQLLAAGRAASTTGLARAARLRIRIHGRGPLSDLLAASLTEVGLTPQRSSRRPADLDAVGRWDANLVVLSDFLVHEPAIVTALNAARIPHLPVLVRDGVGIVGPLVLPGMSSCMRCADHHRTMLDPDWPLLAAQLLRQPGYATTGIIRSTAALAHEQIEQIASALITGTTSSALPQLFNRALEFRGDPARLEITEWPPHPCCDCRPPIAAAG